MLNGQRRANLNPEERHRTGQSLYSSSLQHCLHWVATHAQRSLRCFNLAGVSSFAAAGDKDLSCSRCEEKCSYWNRVPTRVGVLASTGSPEASLKGQQCADALGLWWERSGEPNFEGSVPLELEPSSMSTHWSQVK